MAVIDTHKLEHVLIFNAAHLVGIADLEDQAHGRIKGPGYKAMKFQQLIIAELVGFFPEL